MFGIISNENIDTELFNEMYEENQSMIDELVFYMDKSDKLLEVKIDEFGYDKARKLLEFLSNCEVNYTTVNLISSLEGYCEKKEDEAFLDLYMAIQNGSIEEWMKECDLTKINMLYKNFQDDQVISLIFPDMVSYVSLKEKELHI